MNAFYKIITALSLPLYFGSCALNQPPTVIVLQTPSAPTTKAKEQEEPKEEQFWVMPEPDQKKKQTLACSKFPIPKMPVNPKLTKADIEAIVKQSPSTYNDQLLAQIERMNNYIKKSNEAWARSIKEHQASCRVVFELQQ